jgi:hypothetical protein
MRIAQIDRDYISAPEFKSRAGIYWTRDQVDADGIEDASRLRFRMKDDDGEIYYGGWLLNDPQGEVQLMLLQWGAHDAGCTSIEVKLDGKWVEHHHYGIVHTTTH